ncbi:ATPase [Marinobacterium aestuariivivens]|uniref:ATPase n=1 Tax=Marinobacterium aestuariivivens TaxID=1698799 RepID=A0ABW2A7Y4_9GAMM
MKIETLKDVLHWTADLHRQLSRCLADCENRAVNERARLLLDFLEQHEEKLARVVSRFEEMASSNALNTWCYEYFDKNPESMAQICDTDYNRLEPEGVMARILEQHNQVIELYRYLRAQSGAASARDLLQNLIALEEHEAMQMAQGSNRLEDI